MLELVNTFTSKSVLEGTGGYQQDEDPMPYVQYLQIGRFDGTANSDPGQNDTSSQGELSVEQPPKRSDFGSGRSGGKAYQRAQREYKEDRLNTGTNEFITTIYTISRHLVQVVFHKEPLIHQDQDHQVGSCRSRSYASTIITTKEVVEEVEHQLVVLVRLQKT